MQSRSEITTQLLSTVLSQPQNIKAFKKYIDRLDETEYKRILYQLVTDINENKEDLQSTLSTLKNKSTGWNHPTFKVVKQKLEEHDDYLVKPFEVAEGVVECKKCGSNKTFSVQKQVRSSDEPMTTFSRCVQCGATWTYDG